MNARHVSNEQVRTGWFLLMVTACGLAIAAAVLLLARSPLLSDESSVSDGSRKREQPQESRAGSTVSDGNG